MNQRHIVIALIILAIIFSSLLIMFIDIARAYSDTITITIDPKLFYINNTEYKGEIEITISTSYNFYSYHYVVCKNNNSIEVDLTRPLNDYRRYYNEIFSSSEKVGEIHVPTLNIKLILYSRDGKIRQYRYVYDPLKYYLEYEKLDYPIAYNRSWNDPFKAFDGVEIYLSEENMELITIKDLGKPKKIIRDIGKIDIECNEDESVCEEIIPELQALFQSRYEPPEEWYTYISVDPEEFKNDVIKAMWERFATAYSIRTYLDKDEYDYLEAVQIAKSLYGYSIIPNSITIRLMYNYIGDLFELTPYYGLPIFVSWDEEERVLYKDLPVGAVNVSYKEQLPIEIELIASGTDFSGYYAGITFGLIPIHTRKNLENMHGMESILINPNVGPSIGYIVVPVEYMYYGSALIINISISSVVINDEEYWMIEPFFLPVPFYEKEVSYFNDIYITSSYNISELNDLIWSRNEVTIFNLMVTEDYPTPNSEFPRLIFEEHIATQDSSIGETTPGVVTGIILSLFNEVKGKILGYVAPGIGEYLSKITDIGYMEFNARSSTFDELFKVYRSTADDFNAHVEVIKYTLSDISNDYLPLMIMYKVVVDDIFEGYGGEGFHYEEVGDSVFSLIARDYAYAESTGTSESRSWFKYSLVVDGERSVSIDASISYSLYYDICTNGYVYLKTYIKVFKADDNTLVYSNVYTLFEKQCSEQPPDNPIPTSNGEVSGSKDIYCNLDLGEGEYYVIIEVVAYAESYYGYAYIDAHSDGYGVNIDLDIDLT